MPLSDAKIKNAKVPPGQRYAKFFDGEGLYLVVMPNGSKLWRLKYRHGGRERTLSLGPLKTSTSSGLTLKEARIERQKAKDLLREHKDPNAVKREAKAASERSSERTFEAYATQYHAEIAPGFRHEKDRKQWLSSLGPVFKALGARDLGDITQADLIRVLKPILAKTPETGRRVRQRITEIFAAAVADELIPASPAASLANRRIRKRTGETTFDKSTHFRSLPFGQVPALYAALVSHEAKLSADPKQGLSAVRALRLALLCAARSGEVRGLTWDELSADDAKITIPGSRMKMKAEHVVYLSEPAQAIIREQRKRTGGKAGGLVFPGRRLGGVMFDATLRDVLHRLPTGDTDDEGKPITYVSLGTVHGLRAGFSSWCRETNAARPEVRELCLSHKTEDAVASAYTHQSTLATERAALMQAWARYVTGAPEEKVVDIDTRRQRRAR